MWITRRSHDDNILPHSWLNLYNSLPMFNPHPLWVGKPNTTLQFFNTIPETNHIFAIWYILHQLKKMYASALCDLSAAIMFFITNFMYCNKCAMTLY